MFSLHANSVYDIDIDEIPIFSYKQFFIWGITLR